MVGVVMLVNEFSPLPVGGAERQAERLSVYLAGRGWPVWVITRGAPGLPANEARQGFRVIRPQVWGVGKLQTVFFVLGALWVIWRLRKEFSILHAHLAFGSALVAVLAARLLGKRVLVKLGNSGEFGDIRVSQKTWRGKLRLAIIRKWADAIIVLDADMHTEALAAGFNPQRLRRMVNGIDARKYVSLLSRSDAQVAIGLAGRVIVLSMGRLVAQKSLPLLLYAFANALTDCPDLHLMMLGDGSERPALEALARSLNILERVTFTGNKTDIVSYLQAADIFVLPSASEGISNALLEAMAAGLACVATPVGGNSEVLDHGRCGVLLPVGDVQAWSNALVTLSKSANERERLGIAARERIYAEYDFEIAGMRYESIYAELLGSSQQALKTLAEVKQ